jgi:hypothetical protein
MTPRVKWLVCSPLGLALIGFGLTLVTDAARAKGAGEPWFWYGAVALVVFNAGIAVFGEGVKNAVLMSLERRGSS